MKKLKVLVLTLAVFTFVVTWNVPVFAKGVAHPEPAGAPKNAPHVAAPATPAKPAVPAAPAAKAKVKAKKAKAAPAPAPVQ